MYPWPRPNRFSPHFERLRGRVNHHWLSKQNRLERNECLRHTQCTCVCLCMKKRQGIDVERFISKSLSDSLSYFHTHIQCTKCLSACRLANYIFHHVGSHHGIAGEPTLAIGQRVLPFLSEWNVQSYDIASFQKLTLN